MPLEYYLSPNYFTTDNDEDYLAYPVNVQVNTREDLIRDITGPGSILKPTETGAVIDNYWGTITGYIRKGETYSDEYISIRFGIGGVYQNEEDQFDPARHALVANSILKDSVTSAVDEVELRKIASGRIAPEIRHVYDWGSDTTDDRLTPGGVLEVTGQVLKIHDNLEEEEGVFFISQAGDSEVRADQLRTNEPQKLTLRIPEALTAGTYRLEIRNTSRNGKSLRTGIFAPVLTIE